MGLTVIVGVLQPLKAVEIGVKTADSQLTVLTHQHAVALSPSQSQLAQGVKPHEAIAERELIRVVGDELRGDLAVQPALGTDGGEGLQGTVFLGGEVGVGNDPEGDPEAEQKHEEQGRDGDVDLFVHRHPLEDIVEEGAEGTADHVGHRHHKSQTNEKGTKEGQAGALSLNLGEEPRRVGGGGDDRYRQKRQGAQQLVANRGRGESHRSDAHHTAHNGKGLGQVGVVEDHPSHADQEKSPYVTQRTSGGGSFKPLEEEGFLKG